MHKKLELTNKCLMVIKIYKIDKLCNTINKQTGYINN